MVELRDKETGRIVGSISEEQLQFLVDQLVEESAADTDYYLDQDTLELFEELGMDQDLLAVLRGALGDRDGIELEWIRR